MVREKSLVASYELPALATTIVFTARTWLGTRFQHQGRVRRTAVHSGGCDCLGLLIGVARELKLRSRQGGLLADLDCTDYGHQPDTAALVKMLGEHLCEVPDISPGSIILMEVDGAARHLGIAAEYPGGELSVIHAYAPARKVVEHRLDPLWAGKVRQVFSCKGW